MIKDRSLKATDLLIKHGIQSMLYTDLSNIRYLTGFTGTDGALIVSDDSSCFLTDSRYIAQAKQQIESDILEYSQKVTGISDYVRSKFSGGCLGIESQNLSVDFFDKLQKALGGAVDLKPIADTEAIRSIKDPGELDLLQKSAEISRVSLEGILDRIRPGISEKEVALALEIATRQNGSEVKAFDFIVASGARGAMPHGVASDKIIEQGDVVTIDFGSCYKGYFSDETINIAVGIILPEMKLIHDIVLEAHDRAIHAVRPGILLRDIDKVARDFIAEKGYGDFFGHGLGHGVGLQVHETPRVSPKSEARAESGMVFTIEPGIYKPGLGGVRIEDMVVVTGDGCRCLTSLPKELRVLSN